MDALSANPTATPSALLGATPASTAALAPAAPPTRSGTAPNATTAPATPAVDAPALPLSVQRDQLRPPAPPLMTGAEMSALLRAVVSGT